MQKMTGAKGQIVLVIPAETQKPETVLLPRGPQHSSSGPPSHCSTTAPSDLPLLVHLTPGTSPDPPTAPALFISSGSTVALLDNSC